jgi:Tfp pilus assembly protein PilV
MRKVQASTILEVVISMVIIVFVIGIALMILSNVLRLSLSVKQLKASSILQQEMEKVKALRTVSDEVLQINDWRVEKTFKPFSLGGSLLEADLAIYDQNNVKITELKSVIIHETK